MADTEIGWDQKAAEAAARSVIAKNKPLAIATNQPFDELTCDLVSNLWEAFDRGVYDSKRGGFARWANVHCWGRLRDFAAKSGTKKAKTFTQVEELPEIPQESVTHKPLDHRNRMEALACIARCQAAATIPPSNEQKRSPFTEAQLCAVLVLQRDRNTSLRGICLLLKAHQSLRNELQMEDGRIPSVMALFRARQKWWGKKNEVEKIWRNCMDLMGELERMDEPEGDEP